MTDRIEKIKCPLCQIDIDVSIKWAEENGRVFCPNCCKAFDVSIKEDEDDYLGDFYD
jgi:endogenous inhibitor of DNA gyrase (YacG/DUF329 family)